MALPDFPIPPLHFFEKGSENPFCGSLKGFNYRVCPVKATEDTPERLLAYTWYGMECSDIAPRQAEATFPLDADGRLAAIEWLKEQNRLYQAQLPEEATK